jgi:16S rRNA C1402 (ribose-2'-O) methylase RsmI
MSKPDHPHGSFTAFGIRAAAEPLAPGLHVVATPIGNLRDMSLRALATLAAADLILAEDTRVTKVLLAHYGISTPLAAYHEHNANEMRPRVLARRARLTELGTIPATIVLFESPRRLAEMLADAAAMLGARPAAVARELTKMHETVKRGTLPELAALYAAGETARGEIVVLIGQAEAGAASPATEDLVDGKLKAALGAMSLKEAVAQVTADTGLPRRKVYARALELTRTP